MTALAYHVPEVVAVRRDEQVCGVDAEAVIAPMADAEASWNLAASERMGDTVRGIGAPDCSHPERSVAVCVEGARPDPAIPGGVELDDLRPKAVWREDDCCERGV